MNNLTTEEIKAINSWTSPLKEYRIIKAILNNNYDGNLKFFYKSKADILVGLFNKYEDNTNNQVLFRGDVLESQNGTSKCNKEIYNEYLNKYKIGNVVSIEDSIMSFTLSKEIAIKSYKDSDKNKSENTPTILYVLTKRKSTFLDISKYSHFPNEQEVICNMGIELRVTKLEECSNNHLICHIDEI